MDIIETEVAMYLSMTLPQMLAVLEAADAGVKAGGLRRSARALDGGLATLRSAAEAEQRTTDNRKKNTK